jgi:hypothetical protein
MTWPSEQWDRGRKLGCRGECHRRFSSLRWSVYADVLVACPSVPINSRASIVSELILTGKEQRTSSVKTEKLEPMCMNIQARCMQPLQLLTGILIAWNKILVLKRTFSRNCAFMDDENSLPCSHYPTTDYILASLIQSTHSDIIHLINFPSDVSIQQYVFHHPRIN